MERKRNWGVLFVVDYTIKYVILWRTPRRCCNILCVEFHSWIMNQIRFIVFLLKFVIMLWLTPDGKRVIPILMSLNYTTSMLTASSVWFCSSLPSSRQRLRWCCRCEFQTITDSMTQKQTLDVAELWCLHQTTFHPSTCINIISISWFRS